MFAENEFVDPQPATEDTLEIKEVGSGGGGSATHLYKHNAMVKFVLTNESASTLQLAATGPYYREGSVSQGTYVLPSTYNVELTCLLEFYKSNTTKETITELISRI